MLTFGTPDPIPRILVVGLCLAAASTSGCAGGDSSRADAYVVRDSAGVRIVENSASPWTSDDRWRVADTPAVVIGAGTDDERALLYNVSGARRLDDGRFVVASDGSKQLLFFDSAGNHLHSVGRQGEGPGEFECLTALDDRRRRQQRLDELTYADRLPAYAGFIHDAAGNLWVENYRRAWEEESRWTVFTPEGVMLGSLELPRGLVLVSGWVEIGQIGNHYVLGVMRDELDVERVVSYRLVK